MVVLSLEFKDGGGDDIVLGAEITDCNKETTGSPGAGYYWKKRSELRSELELLTDKMITYTVRCKRMSEEENQMKKDIVINKRKRTLLEEDIAKIRAELDELSVLPKKGEWPVRNAGIKELFDEMQEKLAATLQKKCCLEMKIKETADLIKSQKKEAKSKCSSIREEIKMRKSGEGHTSNCEANKLEKTTSSNYSTVRFREVRKELKEREQYLKKLYTEIQTKKFAIEAISIQIDGKKKCAGAN